MGLLATLLLPAWNTKLLSIPVWFTPGSYIIATDGVMRDLADVPGGQPEWVTNNPRAAADDFAVRHPEFRHQQPAWPFHEGDLTENVTYWPGAWLERVA